MGISSIMTFLLLPLLISVSKSNPISSSIETFINCLSLHSPSPITVLSPNSTSYFTVLQSTFQNPRFNTSSTLKPLLIISPSQESHVQSSVICCKEHGMQLKIRSGGHDYEGLSYVSDQPFVILDLANFTSISVDLEVNTAWVEAGATVGEVYYKIAQRSGTHGFPAAWCPTVGVGGLFSGGGIGTLMRKYGLAADNIVDAHIVDSSGRVLDRGSMGEDLFWAIRGGGAASFGVVLSWKIRLVHVPYNVSTFSIKKNIEENATELVSKWQQVASKLNENLFIRVELQGVGVGANRTVQASFDALYLGEAKGLHRLMEDVFPELGVRIEDCVEMSWIESVLFFAGFPSGTSKEVLIHRVTPSPRAPFKGKSDFVKKPFPIGGFQGIWSLLKENVIGIMIMEPFGGKMSEISKSELPFPHRKGNLHIVQYIVVLQNEKSIDWMNRLYSYMTPYVSKAPRAAYLNFRDLDLGKNDKWNISYSEAKSWGLKYFKGNFKRLALVKGMVDTDYFFRNEQSISPLK